MLPTLGRMVAFVTTDFSYHGHPRPLRAPRGRSRRSFAMYYYTVDRPATDCADGNCRPANTRFGESAGVCPLLGGAPQALDAAPTTPCTECSGRIEDASASHLGVSESAVGGFPHVQYVGGRGNCRKRTRAVQPSGGHIVCCSPS